jgi:hypothetical protein
MDELLAARIRIESMRAELACHRALLLAVVRAIPNRDMLVAALSSEWEGLLRDMLTDPSASAPAYFDAHTNFERTLRLTLGQWWAVGSSAPEFRPDD